MQLNSNIELITQLRHNLTTKTELLHVYSNSAIEDYSPVKNKVSVETLQRKIRILEEENKLVRDVLKTIELLTSCFFLRILNSFEFFKVHIFREGHKIL